MSRLENVLFELQKSIFVGNHKYRNEARNLKSKLFKSVYFFKK